MACLEEKGTVESVNNKSDESTDSDARQQRMQYKKERPPFSPALTPAQLDELMARCRQRFQLTDG